MYRVHKWLWWSSSERWPVKICFGFIVVVCVYCFLFFSSFFFCLHMNTFEIPLSLFSLLIFSSLLRLRHTHTHTYIYILCSWCDSHSVCQFFPLDFAHIWWDSYHRHTFNSWKSFFLALICIPMLKMIVGLNHTAILPVVALLTSGQRHLLTLHNTYIFILIKSHILT